MSTPSKFPGQQGFAWRDGWQERLYALLQKLGFDSVTDYVESRPGVSLIALADELGSGNVAAVQIEWRWVAEAEATFALERCARSLLVRNLREQLPEGWQRDWKDVPGDPTTPLFRKVGAFSDFVTALPDSFQYAAHRIRVAFNTANIIAGWLPSDADDPVIVDIFRRHWSEPAGSAH